MKKIDAMAIRRNRTSRAHLLPKIVFLPNYCTPDFIDKGYFEKAYHGDVSAISDVADISPIDYFLLCKVKTVTIASPTVQDLFTSRIDLGFLLLDKFGRQENRGTFEVASPGLSEESAVDRGIELLTQAHSPQFLTGVADKGP